MRRLHLSALTLSLWAGVAHANGGGYSFGVTFTGSVAPFQASGTEQVRIEEEALSIELHRTDASVVVRYAMRNVADRAVTVRFGFPVEATPAGSPEEFVDVESAEATPEQRQEVLTLAMQQLRGYAVTADGAQVGSEFQVEPFATGKVKPFPGSEALKDVAGWMVSEVTFPASATRILEIRYSARYKGGGYSVSDDDHADPLTFVYRLSTGAVWNGTIGKGTVTVTVDGIPADEVELAAPRERFKRDGDRWVWQFRELEPTLADDLTIRAVPGYYQIGEIFDPALREKGAVSYLERGGAWGEGHQRFRARASSTLPRNKAHDFGAQHLAEATPDAPWSEGVAGPGIGEWVELEPVKPAPLLALEIAPGFGSYAKPELFTANGRPARIEILLNGEHRFQTTLADHAGRQLIPIVGYAKPVSRLRITILGAYPGTRYQDTCISRVVLYDRLNATPDVHGAR